MEESGSKEEQQTIDHNAKRAVDRARFDLKLLLEQPLLGSKNNNNQNKNSNKNSNKVSGKNSKNNMNNNNNNPSRKRGFVVFAK